MAGKSTLSGRPWSGCGLAFVVISTFVGCSYVVAQWIDQGSIDDPWFVGILMGNTALIFLFVVKLKVLVTESALVYERELKGSEVNFRADKFLSQTFGWNPAFIYGLLFGSIFFIVADYLSLWGDATVLNYLLAAFLMSINIVTGMALFSLWTYLSCAWKIGRSITVELWDRNRPSLTKVVATNRHIVLATSTISCIAIASLIFSKFKIGVPLIIFSLFAVIVSISTYLIPLIPISAQIRRKKILNINHLSGLIEHEYKALQTAQTRSDARLDTSRFDSLTSLCESVKSVKEFPPIGEFSKSTAISVILLTLLPSLIQFLLELI